MNPQSGLSALKSHFFEAKYEMVMKGAREEEKTAVEALYHQAENVYNEALAYHKELTITAPVEGELSKRIAVKL